MKFSKLTSEKAQTIIDCYVSGSSSDELARQFCVSRSSINNIVSGKYYKKCNRPVDIDEISQSRKGLANAFYKYPTLLNAEQRQIIEGSLLGDGSIRITSSNCYFSKNQCPRYESYIDWHVEKLSPFAKPKLACYSKFKARFCPVGRKVVHDVVPRYLQNYMVKTCCHPEFNEFRRLWYDGRHKQIPSQLQLTPLSLAIWYFDDGSNDGLIRRRATLCTNSFSFNEVDMLRDKLYEQFQIISSVRKGNNENERMITVTKSSFDTLIDIVSPYCQFDCFQYKIQRKV